MKTLKLLLSIFIYVMDAPQHQKELLANSAVLPSPFHLAVLVFAPHNFNELVHSHNPHYHYSAVLCDY